MHDRKLFAWNGTNYMEWHQLNQLKCFDAIFNQKEKQIERPYQEK